MVIPFFGRRGAHEAKPERVGDEPRSQAVDDPSHPPDRRPGYSDREARTRHRRRAPRVEPELESFVREEETRAAPSTLSRGRRQTQLSTPEKPAAPAKETASSTSTTTRRRRRSGRTKAAEAAVPPPSPEPPPEPPPPAPPARRRRRAGKTTTAEVPAARAPAPKPAAEGAELEGLLSRQGAVQEAYAAEQLKVLQGMQRSLGSLEARLGSALGRGTPSQQGLVLPRVGIFVDVPNVMYSAERRRITIDFGRLLDLLSRGRELVRASAYAPISDDPVIPLSSQKFVQPFVDHGYRIVTKALKRFADGSIKANFDVELAIDVLTMSDRLDIVSLVSGDGDFRRLVELVASKGVRVEVVAFAESTSAELRAVADDYIDLAANLDELLSR